MTRSALRRWRRTIGALLLLEAVRRFGFGVAVGTVPLVWVWRIHPPWELRGHLWRLDRVGGVAAALGLCLAWAVVTAPVVRMMLRSARLEYWRQFPISRAHWFRLHAVHVACIDAPGVALAIWLLAPWNDALAIAAATTGLAVLALGIQIALALAPLPKLVGSPRSRTIVGALVRLHAVTVIRRDRPAVAFAIAGQVLALAGPCSAWATWRATTRAEPPPCSAAQRSFRARPPPGSCSGRNASSIAIAGTSTRKPACIRPRSCAPASCSASRSRRRRSSAWSSPPHRLGSPASPAPCSSPPSSDRGPRSSSPASARAQKQRVDSTRRSMSVRSSPSRTASVALVLDPLALVVASALELRVARRALARATAQRIRFETTHREDDHG